MPASRQQREAAAAARRRFVSPFGDHLTLLNMYQAYSLVGRSLDNMQVWGRKLQYWVT